MAIAAIGSVFGDIDASPLYMTCRLVSNPFCFH
jgi:K+ transporter